MNMNEQSSASRDKLISDLKAVIKDAEELLRSTGQQVGQQMDSGYQAARSRFESTLQSAKGSLGDVQGKVTARSQDAMDTTQRYVQDNPWQAIGIGAAAGLVLGLLLTRGK